jgi:hypothetical protein
MCKSRKSIQPFLLLRRKTLRKRRLKMSKKKMSEEEFLRLELVEALRSLNGIVTDEECENLDEESKDEKLSDEE